jgi:L-asparagine transporter-like permease
MSIVPYKGILFSGLSMLIGLFFGLLFPRAYLVLITSGGFALIFTYAVIMASHIRFRKREGCPPGGICQMPGFPLTSWLALISLIIILLCMPFIPGQTAGLITGSSMVVIYSLIYFVMSYLRRTKANETAKKGISPREFRPNYATELARELSERVDERNKDK